MLLKTLKESYVCIVIIASNVRTKKGKLEQFTAATFSQDKPSK